MQENSSNWNNITAFIFKISLFLALASHLSSSIYMPQFFEYLTRGHWILKNNALPSNYIWAKIGAPVWSDPNWIFEIVLSFVETQFGDSGLIILKIVSIFLAIFSTNFLYHKVAKNGFFAGLLTLLVSAGFFVTSDLLPYCFSLFLCSLFLNLILSDVDGLLEYLGLFLLSFLIVNTDAVVGVFLIGAVFLSRKKLPIIAILLLSFLAPPYYGRQIIDALSVEIKLFSWDVLLQRHPSTIFDFRFAFLLIIWILIGIGLHNIKCKTFTFLAFIASLLGLSSNVYLPLALFCSGLLLASLWDTNINIFKSIELLEQKLAKLSPIGVIWILVVICIITIKPRIAYPISYALLPKQQIDIALSRGLKLPIYHDSFAGSYLTYRFSTAGILPQDSVLSTPMAEAYNDNARMDYLSQSLNPNFLRYFDFIAPKSVICRVSEPLCSHLLRSQNWKLIETGSKEIFGWNLFERAE